MSDIPAQQPSAFIHSGDRGDIIYALPVLKHWGPSKLYIYPVHWTRVKLTKDQWCGLDRLIGCQPYITGVEEVADLSTLKERTVNLNEFRVKMVAALRTGTMKAHRTSLTDWMLTVTNTPLEAKHDPWLTVPPVRVAKVIVNRSGAGRPGHAVYHNREFPWGKIAKKYLADAAFIGSPEEHAEFRDCIFDIPYHPTADLYEAAQVIAGCDLFIGNQSAPAALAEGLKKRIIMEVWPGGPNCLFFRDGVTHVWNRSPLLPEL